MFSPVRSEDDRFRRAQSLHPPQFFHQSFILTQFCEWCAISFVFTCTARQQLLIAVIQVLGDFLDDRSLPRRRKFQSRQSLPDLYFPVRHESSPPEGNVLAGSLGRSDPGYAIQRGKEFLPGLALLVQYSLARGS